MTRMTRTALSLACALALVAGLAPSALAQHRPNWFCSTSGDYCQYAKKNGKGIRFLVFRSFAHRGEVKVCVRAPDGTRSCINDRFTDANDDSLFVTRLRWNTNFPNQGPGDYSVRWKQDGARTGKILGFHKR